MKAHILSDSIYMKCQKIGKSIQTECRTREKDSIGEKWKLSAKGYDFFVCG